MATYKNKGGGHTYKRGGKIQTVKPGETFESEHDLCRLFPGKFQLLGDDDTAEPAPTKEPAAPTTKGPEPKPVVDGPGDDVTAEFAGAAEAGLQVFRKDGKWNVYDGDPNEPADRVNPEPLRKKDVPALLIELGV